MILLARDQDYTPSGGGPAESQLVDVSVKEPFIRGDANDVDAIDISDPLDPQVLGSVSGGERIVANSRYIFAAGGNRAVLLDLINRMQPRVAATMRTNGSTRGVALHDGLAFIANGTGGLLIVRLPPPADVNLDGRVDTSDVMRLLNNFGRIGDALPGHGDLDEDGDVDLSDLTELLAAFGDTCG